MWEGRFGWFALLWSIRLLNTCKKRFAQQQQQPKENENIRDVDKGAKKLYRQNVDGRMCRADDGIMTSEHDHHPEILI